MSEITLPHEAPLGLPEPLRSAAAGGFSWQVSAHDPDVLLLLPEHDVSDPEITLLIPAVNESITMTEFVAWCHEGLARAGTVGEILIVDSSDDDTPLLALASGARVLHTPRRGLGRAYIDAIPYVRGEFIIMGDADCTYDFRDLAGFVEAMRNGAEYAMGSRWKGSIERGAMPPLHQYLGTPVTTWILNRLFNSHFTDIHCGMRGITRDALIRMGLVSQSWEYASELVLKSVRMGLVTEEVPVTFLKDQEGRLSHHKRAGWFSPFAAAWINLRAMFVHGAEFFLFKPGIAMFVLGILMVLPLSAGPVTLGSITFGLYFMLLGVTFSLVGMQSVYFGCLAHVFLDYSGDRRERWRRLFSYTRATLVSAGLFALGLVLDVVFVVHWVASGMRIDDVNAPLNYTAILGLLLMIMGFSTFCFTLLIHATAVRYGRSPEES